MNATLNGIFGQFEYWRKANFPAKLADANSMHVIVGCGTSYNLALSVAAMMNANGFRALAVPSGEWIERAESYVSNAEKDIVVIALSRSGTTTETVQAARISRERGQKVIGITCEPGSALSSESDLPIEFDTHPEEGIVMTSSASLMLLAGYALSGMKIDGALIDSAEKLVALVGDGVSDAFLKRDHFVFLGGGSNYGVALEGSLKLQEMAIAFTQAYHPGEYRHGPVSLVDEGTVVVMLYHPDTAKDESVLVKELQDKGALVIGLGGPGDVSFDLYCNHGLCGAEVLPALQVLGERYALARRIDTTAPRHLSKVVVLDA